METEIMEKKMKTRRSRGCPLTMSPRINKYSSKGNGQGSCDKVKRDRGNGNRELRKKKDRKRRKQKREGCPLTTSPHHMERK